MERTNVPNATINRIPLYLRSLQEIKDRNRQIISSHELAELVGVQPAQLRKDLSYLGEFGTRGVGYEVEHLEFQLARRLGLTREWSIAVIGAGRIGSALLYYKAFSFALDKALVCLIIPMTSLTSDSEESLWPKISIILSRASNLPSSSLKA
ncbi:redox-sensing transcriptional repressor [Candidatus Hakubella thermalkaliphila]|uniref:Redox-sensing transcriptional repressor n=1 Tax=Candidatus Hakubella thermalkaliphila TaxID=2754717 RepID=A0A6V8NM85_9ACTN|nr:redox-sensing transcriptional repressor [Candidatus Hakubella thermalkaliphila]